MGGVASRRLRELAWAGSIAITAGVLILGFLVLAAPAVARPGSLDMSFGGDGRVEIGSGSKGFHGYSAADDLAKAPGGRLLVAIEDRVFNVAVFKRGGNVDRSFSSDGVVQTAVGREARAAGVAPQGKKILAVGQMATDGRCPRQGLVVRYQKDGKLDRTFAGDGIFTGFPCALLQVAEVDPKRGIVVLGFRQPGKKARDFLTQRAFVARFDFDGTLDRSFGRRGIRDLPKAGFTLFPSIDLDVRPDGRILVISQIGRVPVPSKVAQLTPQGDLDPSFGKRGVMRMPPHLGGHDTEAGYAIHALPNGRAMVLLAPPSFDWANTGVVTRLLPDGRIDRTYGENGVAFHQQRARMMAVSPSGRVVVGAGVGAGFSSFTPAGRPDRRFSEDGYMPMGYNALSGGSIELVGGRLLIVGDGPKASTRLRAVTRGGRPARAFGRNGSGFAPNRHPVREAARDIDLLPGGDLLISGTTPLGYPGFDSFARIRPDGRPAAGFGVGGFATSEVPYAFNHFFATLGQTIYASTTDGNSWGAFLARFGRRGRRDTKFSGREGRRVAEPGFEPVYDEMQATSGGKLLLTGTSGRWRTRDVFLQQLNPDGTPDGSFGSAGLVTRQAGTRRSQTDYALMAIAPDGSITVVGSNQRLSKPFGPYGDVRRTATDMRIFRFQPDGDVDTSFGKQGALTVKALQPQSIASLPDGGIAIGAETCGRQEGHFGCRGDGVVVHITRDGVFDIGFGRNGRAFVPDAESVPVLAVGADGRPTAVTSDDRVLRVVRFRPNGRILQSFGRKGVARVGFGITGTDPEDALITGDSLFIAGTSILPTGADQFVVAKLKLK